MADRENHRGGGHGWRGGHEDGGRSGRHEQRSFGGHGEGEHEPWRRERYGSLYDQDRTNYGSGWDDDRRQYGRGQGSRGRPQDQRQAWRPGHGEPYGDLELNEQGRAYEEFGAPHDYAYHPHHDYEPDYVRWREERMRGHDREYDEWRRERQRRYDEEYHARRRGQHGQASNHWVGERNVSQGMARQDITPETHDYHRRMGAGFGQGQDRPSGALEPPGAMFRGPGGNR